MGYSTTAIFGNDLACDVRATYRELLEDGVLLKRPCLRSRRSFLTLRRIQITELLSGPRLQLPRCNSVGSTTESETKQLRSLILVAIFTCGSQQMPAVAMRSSRSQLLGPQKRPIRVRRPKRELSPVQAGETFVLGLQDGREARFRTLAVHSYRVGDVPIVEMVDERGRPYRDGVRALVAFKQDVPIRVIGRFSAPQKVAMPGVSCTWRALQGHAAKLMSDPEAKPKRGLFH